jgi:hypothetical protein
MLRLRAYYALQQQLQQLSSSVANLSRNLEELEKLENHFLEEPLPTRAPMFEHSEHFGRSVRAHFAELEKFLAKHADALAPGASEDAAPASMRAARAAAVSAEQATRVDAAAAERAAAEATRRFDRERLRQAESLQKLQHYEQLLGRVVRSQNKSSESHEVRLHAIESRLDRIESLLRKIASGDAQIDK